jgi:hypothetical protein
MKTNVHIIHEPAPAGLYTELELRQLSRGRDVTQAREACWKRFAARCARGEVLVDKPHLFEPYFLSPEDEYTPQSTEEETAQWKAIEAEAFAPDTGQDSEPREAGERDAENVYASEGVATDSSESERTCEVEELVYC